MNAEHPAGGRDREHDPREDQRVFEQAALEHDQRHRAEEEDASARGGGEAGCPAVNQRPPRSQHRRHQTREHGKAPREALHAEDHRQHHRRHQKDQRRDRGQPPIHHVTSP